MKRMILLLLSLLVIIALFAACGNAQDEAAALDAAADNMLTNSAQLSVTDASYLEYDNGQVTCRFRKDEDAWKWVDNESFPLDAAYVEAMLTALTEMDTALTPLEQTVELADCGLDDPERYLTVTVGEETTTLYFGDQKDGAWYMRIDGQEDVYLTEAACVPLMDISIYDMAVLPALPELTAGNLTSIIITENDALSRTVRLVKRNEEWYLGGVLMTDGIADVEVALAQFSFDKCFNYDPSPDAAALCGLDAPSAVISISYLNTVGSETELTLTLGTLREDDTYYVTVNDDTTVYLVSRSKLALLEAL